MHCLQLRIELGKYGATFRVKQSQVDEQIADVGVSGCASSWWAVQLVTCVVHGAVGRLVNATAQADGHAQST